jgi:GNAT superfamily N-acetyltransferase
MPQSPFIRPARLSEQNSLEALQLRASLANPGDRQSLLENPDAIELPSAQIVAGQVFVAESDGAALGFSVVLPREDGDAELDGLFVEPGLWRSGIGRALVEHAGEHALGQGASLLHVIGNPHAEAFYRSVGFEIVGTFQTRFGPGWLMRKRLSRRPSPPDDRGIDEQRRKK